MQVLKQHKRLILAVLLLVVALVVGLFIVQQVSEPLTKPLPSPTSSTPLPSSTGKASPTPTGTSSPLATAPPMPALPTTLPSSTPTPTFYPGEVTTYQNQTLTPIYEFINEFLQTSINGAQQVDESTYRLTVDGLVNQPKNYTYDEVLNDFQAHEQVATILCVEGWSATVLWQGVSIGDLLNQSGVNPQANTLIFYAADGYSTSLPLSYVLQNNLILAYKMNNVTLNADTGFPFILVAENQYGYKWIKYVTEIDVSNDSSYLGYWESRGYPNNATITEQGGAAQPSIDLSVEIVSISVAAIIVAVVFFLIFARSNASRSRIWKSNNNKSVKVHYWSRFMPVTGKTSRNILHDET
jgi:DMSO/TMAO reductase YedYZ molybdopterin-dependent catalytic subunit